MLNSPSYGIGDTDGARHDNRVVGGHSSGKANATIEDLVERATLQELAQDSDRNAASTNQKSTN